MSQTVITTAFEQLKAQQAVNSQPIALSEFVFANVPDLDTDAPIDRAEGLPDAAQIVHRQAVSRTGVVNENAVVYSVVLGADVGDFAFNWIGLLDANSGTVAMIVHAPLQQKIKTAAGQQGNVLTRSFLMEFNGAQAETGITTPAETWQIDFTARLAGADERIRKENTDIYGWASFFGDGYLVTRSGSTYQLTAGAGYVAGLRTELQQNTELVVTTKPVFVLLDVAWTGTLTSAWGVESKIHVNAGMDSYEKDGVWHYVFGVARIEEDGTITDLRPKGTLDGQLAESRYLQREKNLSDLTDAAAARNALALKGAALLDVGKSAGTVAAGDDSRIVNALQIAKTPLAVDLNTLGSYDDAGVYFQGADANAKAELNYPVGLSGTLTLTPAAYGCVQEYTTYHLSRKFVRGLIGEWTGSGPWAPWTEIYSENHKPTPAEIGAVPAAGGSVGYLDNAAYYYTAGDRNPAGAGGFGGQLSTSAPFYAPNWEWAPTDGGLYVPLVKGKSTRKGQGWPTAVSFGYLMSGGTGNFAKPAIHVQGDSVDAAWFFDPYSRSMSSDGGYTAGSARYDASGDVTGATWGGGSLSSWLASSFAIRDQNIAARATTEVVNLHVANLNQSIGNKADTVWVQQYFLNDIALGAEGSFLIAKNAWQRVPGGCVLTGYNAEGNEPVNDTLFYRPIQKAYPNVGWMTIGHNA